jgi:hypothetical protein
MTDHFGFGAQEKAVRWLRAAITDLEGVARRMEEGNPLTEDLIMRNLWQTRARFIRDRVAMIQAAMEAIENPAGFNRDGQPNGRTGENDAAGLAGQTDAAEQGGTASAMTAGSAAQAATPVLQVGAAGTLVPVIEGRSGTNGEGKAMRASPDPGRPAAILTTVEQMSALLNVPLTPEGEALKAKMLRDGARSTEFFGGKRQPEYLSPCCGKMVRDAQDGLPANDDTQWGRCDSCKQLFDMSDGYCDPDYKPSSKEDDDAQRREWESDLIDGEGL